MELPVDVGANLDIKVSHQYLLDDKVVRFRRPPGLALNQTLENKGHVQSVVEGDNSEKCREIHPGDIITVSKIRPAIQIWLNPMLSLNAI